MGPDQVWPSTGSAVWLFDVLTYICGALFKVASSRDHALKWFAFAIRSGLALEIEVTPLGLARNLGRVKFRGKKLIF